jgi:hypothetical protein
VRAGRDNASAALLTERKGLQRALFVGSMGVIGVDGTNGAVKLTRGRISKGYTTRYGGFYVLR